MLKTMCKILPCKKLRYEAPGLADLYPMDEAPNDNYLRRNPPKSSACQEDHAGEAKPCIRAVMTIDNPNITQQIVRRRTLPGSLRHPTSSDSRRGEGKPLLAPHWWHLVAVAPPACRTPGRAGGRICFGSDRNIPRAGAQAVEFVSPSNG